MKRKSSKNVFNEFAYSYDSWYDSEEGNPIYLSELRCVEGMVLKPYPPLLEIGVGTGRFAMHFNGAIGVDTSINALRMAEKRGIKAVRADGENLPFKNGSFSCVLIILTLCFVKSPLMVLKEARRVLKKDGNIMIGFIPKGSSWARLYEEKKKKGHPIYSYARFYGFKELEGFLKKAGLEISRIKTTLFQMPDEKPRIEKSMDGYIKQSGFVCLEVKKV